MRSETVSELENMADEIYEYLKRGNQILGNAEVWAILIKHLSNAAQETLLLLGRPGHRDSNN